MKIVTLGSSGALGTAFHLYAQDNDIDLIEFNHSDIDICNHKAVETLIQEQQPDVVINCVAIIGINICEQEAGKCFEVNSTAVSNIAKICNELNITLVQPSSHAVYDGTFEDYYTEEHEPNPINIYAASKYNAECFARNICEKHYVVRFPTMFGPRRNTSLGFVDKMAEKLQNNDKILAPDDKMDSLTYTLDAVQQIMELLNNNYKYGTYNIANEGSCSYYDFVQYLSDLLESKSEIEAVKDNHFPSQGLKPLKTKMKSIYLPDLRNWKDAIKEYLQNTFAKAKA